MCPPAAPGAGRTTARFLPCGRSRRRKAVEKEGRGDLEALSPADHGMIVLLVSSGREHGGQRPYIKATSVPWGSAAESRPRGRLAVGPSKTDAMQAHGERRARDRVADERARSRASRREPIDGTRRSPVSCRCGRSATGHGRRVASEQCITRAEPDATAITRTRAKHSRYAARKIGRHLPTDPVQPNAICAETSSTVHQSASRSGVGVGLSQARCHAYVSMSPFRRGPTTTPDRQHDGTRSGTRKRFGCRAARPFDLWSLRQPTSPRRRTECYSVPADAMSTEYRSTCQRARGIAHGQKAKRRGLARRVELPRRNDDANHGNDDSGNERRAAASSERFGAYAHSSQRADPPHPTSLPVAHDIEKLAKETASARRGVRGRNTIEAVIAARQCPDTCAARVSTRKRQCTIGS